LNPGYKLGKPVFTGEKPVISKNDFEKYLLRRNLQGLTKQWEGQCTLWLKDYLNSVSWKIDEDKTLEYCKKLKDNVSLVYYKKQVYQIKKFLEYVKVDWASSIRLPADPEYIPKRVTVYDIQQVLSQYEQHQFFKQIKAAIFLGCSSGLRAQELYQLTPNDIDVENRVVHINHNPLKRQSTKTGKSRMAFFNQETQKVLVEYFEFFHNGNNLQNLFTQSHLTRIFKDTQLKIKDTRKFFSQEWDRRGGATGIKKLIMGHSIRSDVDMCHYNGQNIEDLKRIYDKVMGALKIQ
jgi:integrase